MQMKGSAGDVGSEPAGDFFPLGGGRRRDLPTPQYLPRVVEVASHSSAVRWHASHRPLGP